MLFVNGLQVPIDEDNTTQLTEHGEVRLMPTQNFHPYVLASLVQEATLQATKGETQKPVKL